MSATTESLFPAASLTDVAKPAAAAPEPTVQGGWSAFEVWRSRVWRRPDIADIVPTAVRQTNSKAT